MYNKELASKYCLVIDDFSDMRSMLQGMLRSLGVTKIETANNGKSAIEQLERHRFDVVLCDYNLGPGKDGQQVLEEAKHRELVGIGTIFVMITAENTREMVMGAVEYAPDSYLSKPFTKDVLEARLNKLVAKKTDLAAVQKAVHEKQIGLAVKLLDERIQKKPKNMAELVRYKGELCLQAGKLDMAADIYERALAVRAVPWAMLGIGRVHYQRGDFSKAEHAFREMIEENEGFISAYDWLAKSLKAMGELKEAQETLKTAVSISPKAILRQKELGNLALANNDLESAEKAFDKAVSLGKYSIFKHPETYAKLACTKSKRDANEDALSVIKQLSREYGNDKEAQLFACSSQSTIYTNMGQPELAKEQLQEAEKLYETMGEHLDQTASLEMARAFAGAGEKERSLEIMQDIVRNNHDNEELLREVEQAYKQIDPDADTEGVIDGVRKEIVKLNNEGVSLVREGKLADAIGLFEKAAEGMPRNRVINLNAAKATITYMQKNGPDNDHIDMTRKYLDRIRKLEPDNPKLKQLHDSFVKIVTGGS